MSKYKPVTAERAAEILGWDYGGDEDFSGVDAAGAALSGEDAFELSEVAKIAAHFKLTVEGLAIADGRFARYVGAETLARWEIARKLVTRGSDTEAAAEICGLSAETVKRLKAASP